MICPNCNQQIPDNSAFCSVCGANFSTAAPNTQSTPAAAMPVSKSNKKVFIILGAVVAAVAIILVFVFGSGGGGSVDHSSPEALIKSYFSTYENKNLETCLECFSDYAIEELIDDMGVNDRNELLRAIKHIRDQRGNFSCFVNGIVFEDTLLPGNSDFEDVIEELDSDYDLSPAEEKAIEEFAKIKASVTITQNGVTDTDSLTFTLIKIDSKWYILWD